MLRSGLEYLRQLEKRQLNLTVGDARADLKLPALATQAKQVARYYDAQSTLLGEAPNSEDVGWVHVVPRTVEELQRKADAFLALARAYDGFLGRAPDYMGAWVAAFGAAAAFFGEHASAVQRLARRVASEDLFVTHSTTKLRARDGKNTKLDVTRTPGGLRVRGARSMATSAPLSDELMIVPTPGDFKLSPTERLVASVATDERRLHFFSRQPFPGRSRLALAYEETDCLAVFDDVLIPWEQVYVFEDEDIFNNYAKRAGLSSHLCLHTNARAIAKLESIIGLARYAARVYGLESNDELKVVVGRALRDLGMITACQQSSVLQSEPNAYGVQTPRLFLQNSARVFFIESYPRIVAQLRSVLGGELYHLFSSEAGGSDAQDILCSAWGVPRADVAKRERLTACLYDLLLSDFGTRHELYEAHYVGSERRNATRMWDSHREEVVAWSDERL